MSGAEFAFLAMGLVLGIAAGAALVEVLRARPPARREVRVTVAQDAIPRRASTLADAFTPGSAAMARGDPARGGPADRRSEPFEPAFPTDERRTPVRPGSSTVPPLRDARSEAAREAITGQWAGVPTAVPMAGPDRVGVPVSSGGDPLLAALRVSAAAGAMAARRTTATTAVADHAAGDVGGHGLTPDGGPPDRSSVATAGPQAEPGPRTSGAASQVEADGPCAEQRHLANERCELATRARAQAAAAEETHRAAQRAYDDHQARADEAASATDPRAVRRAKDEAQARFRAARTTAHTTDEVEAAARTWLAEINRINGEVRDATAALAHEREAVRTLTLELERLALEADAARIGAETAAAACLAAREAVAACEEAAAGPIGHLPTVPSGAPEPGQGDDDEPLAAAFGSGGTPRIFRLVRGDRSAMVELVAALAGEDPALRRHWQLALSDLVDAILADSIGASSLEFPADHLFWSPFTTEQNRDIVGALSSLGYRFDGLGGWVDGRVPSQRDLSLAMGYAGLDPMRIRHWPNETEMAELFRDVAVAADERLAGAAGDLTLGELVSMLGRRADGLADVWNDWGRLRPLLLEER